MQTIETWQANSSTRNTPVAIKVLFPWQLTLFQSPPTWFQYVSKLEKRLTGPQTWANISMRAGSCMRGTICKYENGTLKVARNAFSIGEVWNPVCCHGNKLLSFYLGPLFVESYWRESNISDTNWLRNLFSSYLIKICLSIWRHHLANLHILKLEYLWSQKRYLKTVHGIFLLVQTTFLCFKMASTGKTRFSSSIKGKFDEMILREFCPSNSSVNM